MIQNIVLVILAVAALICTFLNIKGQQTIMNTHYKILELISTFRTEMHDTIKQALSDHVKMYHK